MCREAEFDPETSELMLGLISAQRWIYACSRQLMDRVSWVYDSEGKLDFTLFQPFDWIDAGLDNIHAQGRQFPGHHSVRRPHRARRGDQVVDGGTRKRAFTYFDDSINALMKILDNQVATGKIYNIGNPRNNDSVPELAQMMIDLAPEYPEYRAQAKRVRMVDTTSDACYGAGYQDVQNRVPKIDNTRRELDWEPKFDMAQALCNIFHAYRALVAEARGLGDSPRPRPPR